MGTLSRMLIQLEAKGDPYNHSQAVSDKLEELRVKLQSLRHKISYLEIKYEQKVDSDEKPIYFRNLSQKGWIGPDIMDLNWIELGKYFMINESKDIKIAFNRYLQKVRIFSRKFGIETDHEMIGYFINFENYNKEMKEFKMDCDFNGGTTWNISPSTLSQLELSSGSELTIEFTDCLENYKRKQDVFESIVRLHLNPWITALNIKVTFEVKEINVRESNVIE